MPKTRGLRRILFSSALAICAAAGSGLLTAAVTMQPPEPPQPAAITAPEVPADKVDPRPTSRAPRLPASEPVKVHIPAIKVAADVIRVGVDAKGELEVPDIIKQPMLAGWYKLGPSPGELGNAVIVGHVDSEKVGPAVFFNLGKLKQGDIIKVSRKDGLVATFKVDKVTSVAKKDFPAEVVYGSATVSSLRLITCGGQLDKKTKNYLGNVIVFANLVA